MAAYLVTRSPGTGSILDVRHRVEVRCGSHQVNGRWCDVWRLHGNPHTCAELANQSADEQRARGFTVRVRPVVL